MKLRTVEADDFCLLWGQVMVTGVSNGRATAITDLLCLGIGE